MKLLLEGCVDSAESALAAQTGGAARLELCANLGVGGTTPSAGLVAQVRSRVRLPIIAMIRPRGGSFVHTPEEVDAMVRSIPIVRAAGADGIAIGSLDQADRIDVATTTRLVRAAAGMPVVFHRAFDTVFDQAAALDTLIALGIARVLTSGGAATALEGAETLGTLVERAAGRITIMAGGTVRGRTVREIVATSGVREVHARCETDPRQLRAIVDAMAYEA